jgi:hypothetical protein
VWESQISNQHHSQFVMLPFVHNTIQHSTVFHLQNTLSQNAKCMYKDLPATDLISTWFPCKSILPFWPQWHEFLHHYKSKKLKKNNIQYSMFQYLGSCCQDTGSTVLVIATNCCTFQFVYFNILNAWSCLYFNSFNVL